jgi:hypothetical protein
VKTLLTLSFAVIATSGLAAAQSPLTQLERVTSGVVGITPGQTARFNLLYPTVPAPILQILCSATLVFADDQGKALKMTTVSQIIAGRSVSLDLNADTDLAGSPRTQVHAISTGPSGCAFTGTLEVIDNNTQKTVLVVAARKTYPPNTQVAPSQGGSTTSVFSPLPTPQHP